MGMCISRNKASYAYEKDHRIFIQKMRLLQQEISVILKQRAEDNEAYEREMMVSAFKESGWRRERKKLLEEVRRLRRSLEERDERIRKMEDKSEKLEGNSGDSNSISCVSLLLVEQMRKERARRDETVEKWKMLYLAIKNELDDLIHRTHQGTLYWRADEEDLMEELQQELKVKDETIECLKAQIASMEDEEYKRKREVDILRQSLRIMCSKNGITSSTVPLVKSLSETACFTRNITKVTFVN